MATIKASVVLLEKLKLGLNKILATIHINPACSEANKFIAGSWRKADAPQRLLSWAEKYHRWVRSR